MRSFVLAIALMFISVGIVKAQDRASDPSDVPSLMAGMATSLVVLAFPGYGGAMSWCNAETMNDGSWNPDEFRANCIPERLKGRRGGDFYEGH